MASEKSSPQSFSNLWTAIRIQITRYLALLRRRWWLLVLTISLGLCGAAWFVSQQPPAYLSSGRMMVSGQIRFGEGAQYTEELLNFFGTQVELMQSGEVRQRAHGRVQALHPEMPREDVKFEVGQVPKASIFILRAIGKTPMYTQAYLDACMEEYIATKKDMRKVKGDKVTDAVGDELVQLEKEMQQGEELMHDFQKQNNIGFLQEEGNSAGLYLAQLNRQLADLKTEYDLIALLDLDQNLDRQQFSVPTGERVGAKVDTTALPTFGPLAEYQKAKQFLDQLNAERADLGRYLRPKHPSMVALADSVTKAETLLATYRKQSIESLQNRRDSIRLQMTNLEANIKRWEEKALELAQRIAEFGKIKSKAERTKQQYERLLASLRSVDVTKRVDQDMISILEKASSAISTRPGLATIMTLGFLAGAAIGLVILFILDKLDDRIGSFMEFRTHFPENLLGQIPREVTKDGAFALLMPNDTRHALLESFRTLRSSIVFLPVEKARPKTLLVTSATPGEGKTTVSANLAISLAFSGAKTLLIDGDLRRGRLHSFFNVDEHNGFSKVLQQRIPWQEAVVPTAIPNLSLLPRGKTLAHPGEHFLGKVADSFLQEIYKQFDYIVIDSAPVMAADDTLSLAPKIDGTIFVIRFSASSARTSRKSLELLQQRQVNLLGIVCNDVKLSESDYGYGYYYDYTSHNTKELEAGA
jgi:polysaccharide biosynthesis transport protein